MSNRNVIVFMIHGFEGHPNGGWRPWLMAELERENIYSASLVMKNPYKPIAEVWINEIEENVKKFPNSKIILVGHSLGVPAILRFLQDKNPKNILGCVLVSGPYKIDPRAKRLKKVLNSFFEKEFNFGKIKKTAEHFTIIHGSDDRGVNFSQGEFLTEKLDGKLVKVNKGGHLNADSGFFKLPQALKSIFEMI